MENAIPSGPTPLGETPAIVPAAPDPRGVVPSMPKTEVKASAVETIPMTVGHEELHEEALRRCPTERFKFEGE